MAENINELILPIGADTSQFEKSINDVKSAFKELSNTIASTPFNFVTNEQKEQFNGLQRTLKTLNTDVKEFSKAFEFPANSIAGITRKIDELNKKKIALDATTSSQEISNLTQQIEKLVAKKNEINSLGKSIAEVFVAPANSIAGLEKRISDLSKRKINLDVKTNAVEITRLTKEIEKLTAQKNNIDALGKSVSQVGAPSQAGFKKIEDSSKGARTALTSLSLVAQDAPFGFIAIQNNLPAVIASFGELSRGANGLKGAFAQVGSALVGPAGLFLAFSVVTGAVTFAVQKYGSLSNAVTALVSDNQELAKTIAKARKEYESYNNSLDGIELSVKKSQASEQGKIETIKILTETVSNLQNSESKRSNALNQLKSIDKDYYGSFTTSAEDADKLRKATDQLTESIIRQARVKGLESRITEITTALLDIEDAQSKVAPAFTESGKKVEQFLKKASQFGALTFQDVGEVINLDNITKQLQEGDAGIEKETLRLEKTKERLRAELDGIINIGETTKGKEFTLGIDPQDLDAAFNLDKIISSITKFGNALLNINKSVAERKNALKELIAINPQVFSGLSLEKSATLANKDAIESYLRSLEVLKKEKEFNAKASQVNAEFLKAEIKVQEQAAKAEEDRLENLIKLTYAQDNLGNSTDKIVKKNNKYLEQLGEIQSINEAVLEDLNKALGTENAYEKALKDILNFEEYQKAAIDRITKNFRFLQNPLEGLFGTVLEEGIANWQAFGDAVVVEIKRIAAALLAKGVIQLLGNLLAPGLGSVLGKGFQGISDQTLFDFGFGPGSANFSGVQGGAMQMAGAVNLQLRGSDLVASINRTNTTINRVG
jgi:hypothetical protein